MSYKLESRYAGETSTTLDMRADDTTLMAESEEELKSLLMKVKKECEKSWLKTQHSKNKDLKKKKHTQQIMASVPITSWQIDREENGNSDNLYFLGIQNHCRWWLQP